MKNKKIYTCLKSIYYNLFRLLLRCKREENAI